MGVVFTSFADFLGQVNNGYSMWDTYTGTQNYLNDLKPGHEFAASLKAMDLTYNIATFIYSQTFKFSSNQALAELQMAVSGSPKEGEPPAADTISGYIQGLLDGIEFKQTAYPLDRDSRKAALPRFL